MHTASSVWERKFFPGRFIFKKCPLQAKTIFHFRGITLCFEIVGHDCRIWNNFFWHHMISQIVTWQKFLAPTCSITPKIGFTIQCCHGLPDQPKPKNSQKITNVTSHAKHCVGIDKMSWIFFASKVGRWYLYIRISWKLNNFTGKTRQFEKMPYYV